MKDNKTKVLAKKPFISPKLTIHGDVEVITLGFKIGEDLDKAFPINTPKRNLLFS